MRTLIDIPEKQLQELTVISQAQHVSRAEVIREAINLYLASKQRSEPDAFGLWLDCQVDGLAYQEQVRSEW
jgi:metal-responsive CopG/Arc/MetJ family transcriptional regulator